MDMLFKALKFLGLLSLGVFAFSILKVIIENESLWALIIIALTIPVFWWFEDKWKENHLEKTH